jgi:Putative zinc-finger
VKRHSEKDELVGRLAAGYAGQAEPPAPTACLEPEFLAAYTDGALAGDEVERCERHLAACASCRRVLAEMARGTEVLSAADASPAVERARTWSWRWLVPAAATVAAAALWIVLRPASLPPGSAPVETGQMARADEAGARSKLASPPTRDLEFSPQSEVKAAAPAGSGKGQSTHGAEGGPIPPAESRRAEKAAAPARTVAAEQPAPPAQVPPAAAPAKEMLAENAAKAEAQREAAVEAPKDAAQAKPVQPSAERVGVAGAVATDRMAAAAAPVSGPETTKQLTRVARAAAENAPIVIRTPDPLRSWRLGPAGSIQRSTDGGHTWKPQAGGIGLTMLAGSAPTPLICWAVGQKGTILRTIDGSTWEMVAAPTSLDLVGAVARDESSATIIASDGQTWVTTNGGRTWQRRQ